MSILSIQLEGIISVTNNMNTYMTFTHVYLSCPLQTGTNSVIGYEKELRPLEPSASEVPRHLQFCLGCPHSERHFVVEDRLSVCMRDFNEEALKDC